MKRVLLPSALSPSDRPKKPRVWEWTERPPSSLPPCDATKTITKSSTPNTTRPPPRQSTDLSAIKPIDHVAYPHVFEAILSTIIDSRDAPTLRALRATCRAIAARIDAAFLSDITFSLAPVEVSGPLKLARHQPLPPHSRLLGLPWRGQSVASATIEVGPCECHALFTSAAGSAGADIDAEADAGIDTGIEVDVDVDSEFDSGIEAEEAEAEQMEHAAACPAHAHEARVRKSKLGQLDYVRFVGDPHAHSANWAVQADTEIHILDMFPRKGNGWTRMNRATLDSRRISLQAAGKPSRIVTDDPDDDEADLASLGGSPRTSRIERLRRPRRRVLHFRLHEDYEWLFDYCMLPPSDIVHTTVLVSKYRGPVQLEAPEDQCHLCFEASGCRTDPGKLVHVKPDPTRHLSPAEGPLFGLITSLADDWTQRLRHLLKTPYPPPMNQHTAGTITFVGTERWENRWIQSRPNDVLLPSGYAREKIKQCFYWRCLSNIQDAVLGRFTEEIDYTTRNPHIKRWWEFVYLFINEESCFRFLTLKEYAQEVGERELELVLAADI